MGVPDRYSFLRPESYDAEVPPDMTVPSSSKTYKELTLGGFKEGKSGVLFRPCTSPRRMHSGLC